MKDKLRKMMDEYDLSDMFNPFIDDVVALLTSEVEKGKEKVLSDLRKEYMRIQHVLDDEYGVAEQEPHYIGILENWIEEQRKALSDIKEEGKI